MLNRWFSLMGFQIIEIDLFVLKCKETAVIDLIGCMSELNKCEQLCKLIYCDILFLFIFFFAVNKRNKLFSIVKMY
jgi:hypothetical protein